MKAILTIGCLLFLCFFHPSSTVFISSVCFLVITSLACCIYILSITLFKKISGAGSRGVWDAIRCWQ
jgi:uncharacterized protein YqgC (DUF456 family)